MTRDRCALSVIATGRNDSFGARDFVDRLNHLLTSLEQAATSLSGRSLELIVVDWNVVPDRPPLRDVLAAPSQVALRVVEVPPEIHRRMVGAPADSSMRPPRRTWVSCAHAADEFSSSIRMYACETTCFASAFAHRWAITHSFAVDRYDFRNEDGRGVAPASTDVTPFVAMVRHGESQLDRIDPHVDPGLTAESLAADAPAPRRGRLFGDLGTARRAPGPFPARCAHECRR